MMVERKRRKTTLNVGIEVELIHKINKLVDERYMPIKKQISAHLTLDSVLFSRINDFVDIDPEGRTFSQILQDAVKLGLEELEKGKVDDKIPNKSFHDILNDAGLLGLDMMTPKVKKK